MSGSAMQIREHMEVVGSDDQHVGTVDHTDGNRIKLTKRDDPDGSGQHHHYLPMSCVGSIDGNRVKLNVPAAEAKSQATRDGDMAPGR